MPEDKAWERWNTHFSTVVEQEVMGYVLPVLPHALQHVGC
jgi:hypothetical protein